MHVFLFPETSSIYQDEFFTELLVVCMDRIARSARYIRNNCPFLAYQGVEQGRFTCIWLANDGELWDTCLFSVFSNRLLRYMSSYFVQQFAGAAARNGR